MGGRNFKSVKSSKKLPINLPEFLYFNRKKGQILKSSGRNILRIKPSIKFFYAEDSAIGHLIGQRLLIVGGSYKDLPRSLVTMIFLSTFKIESLTPLPEPSAHGWIHEIGYWIYYIGGQTIKNDKPVQASLWRYHQSHNYWQEFTEVEEFNRLYKSLSNYGSCVFNKKILIFGGQVEDNEKIVSNTRVFLIDTEQCLISCESEFDFEVIHPVIASGDKHAILVGGKNPVNGAINKHTLYFSLKGNSLNIEKLDKIKSEVNERYPPVYQQQYAYFVSYPNILVRFRDKKGWYEYSLKALVGKKKKKVKKDKRVPERIDEGIWGYEFFPEEFRKIDKSEPSEESEYRNLTVLREDEESSAGNVNKSVTHTKRKQVYRLRSSSSGKLPLIIPEVPQIYSSAKSLVEKNKPNLNLVSDTLIRKPGSGSFVVESNEKTEMFLVDDQEHGLILEETCKARGNKELVLAPSEFFDGLMRILKLDKQAFYGNSKEFHAFLCEKLEDKEYSISNDFFKFLSIVHLLMDCEPLSDKKKWLCVIQVDLMPDQDRIGRKKFAKAIFRTLKLKNKLKKILDIN